MARVDYFASAYLGPPYMYWPGGGSPHLVQMLSTGELSHLELNRWMAALTSKRKAHMMDPIIASMIGNQSTELVIAATGAALETDDAGVLLFVLDQGHVSLLHAYYHYED